MRSLKAASAIELRSMDSPQHLMSLAAQVPPRDSIVSLDADSIVPIPAASHGPNTADAVGCTDPSSDAAPPCVRTPTREGNDDTVFTASELSSPLSNSREEVDQEGATHLEQQPGEGQDQARGNRNSAENDRSGDDGDAKHPSVSLPPTPESATDKRVHLADQTNYLPRKQVILVFAGLACALFSALMDQTIVSTSLPTITRAFDAGADASWLSTSYLLTSTAFSPLYGRFSDIFGRKTCMISSLVIFLVCSVLCSAAQSINQLIAFRALAGIVTVVMVIVSDIVSLRERGTYQGILGIVVATSNAGGPLVGGALASVGWRWCFIIVIPLIMMVLVAVVLLLPLKKVDGNIKSKLVKIDYLGVALVLAGTVLMILGLNWGGQEYSWSDPRVLASLIVGGALYVVFAVVEAKLVPLPLIPMRLFNNVSVASVLVQTMCSGGIYYLLLFFVPQYTQVIKGYSGVLAGGCLIPLMGVHAVFSVTSGAVISRMGKYRVGVGLMALLDLNASIGKVVGFLILCGIGGGGTLQTTLVAAQNAVDRKDLAVVTSARNFARLFGGTLALAASYTILNNSVRHHLAELDEATIRVVISDPTAIRTGPYADAQKELLLSAYVAAFHNVFYFGLGMILLAFFVTLFGLREYSLDRDDDQKKKEEGKQWMQERKQRKRQAREAEKGDASPA